MTTICVYLRHVAKPWEGFRGNKKAPYSSATTSIYALPSHRKGCGLLKPELKQRLARDD